jgi:hypothetical protein
MRKLIVALSALTVLFAAPAFAASSPAKGTVDDAHRKLSFSGSVDTPVNPYNTIDDGCSGPDSDFCDHYALTVHPDGGAAGYDLKVTLTPGSAVDDIDIYVYDSKGKLLAASEKDRGLKETILLKAPKAGTYDVRINGYLTPVAPTYKGTAELVKPVR